MAQGTLAQTEEIDIDSFMKHILLTLAAMTLMFTACGQNKKEMRTLVAYFSATGTTEAVAVVE